MDKYAEKAVALHKKGYNCAQAVVCAFHEELGMEEEELFRVMEAFGLGMGAMGTCGAVSAMVAVAGIRESDGNLVKPATKKNSYRVSRELIRRFQEKNSSVICRELKGVDTKKVLRSCNGCIEDAAELVKEYLQGDLDERLKELAEAEAAKAKAAKAAKEAAGKTK